MQDLRFAHLSAVLELGTYFAVVPVHISQLSAVKMTNRRGR